MGWRGSGVEFWRAWPVLVALALAAQPVQALAQSTDMRAFEQRKRDKRRRARSEEDELQQRLTEREDKRRPLDPVTIDLAGTAADRRRRSRTRNGTLWLRASGDAPDRSDRSFLELGIEAEAFYSFGQPLSLFAQARLAMEEDWLPGNAGWRLHEDFRSLPRTRRDVAVQRGHRRLRHRSRSGPARFRGRSPLVVGRRARCRPHRLRARARRSSRWRTRANSRRAVPIAISSIPSTTTCDG